MKTTKFKPILFSTPMVQAILDDRKTQTWRIIKETPGVCIFCGCTDEDCSQCIEKTGKPCSWLNQDETVCSACWDFPTDKAKYQVDDVLWVRETFCESNHPIGKYIYKASLFNTGLKLKWKPSIFMPKSAVRIFLKVRNVRAERLQEISDEDCVKEGIIPLAMSAMQLAESGQLYFDYTKPTQIFNDGIQPFWSFCTLWSSINSAQNWEDNPFVWVYEFERIEKPDDFI